MRGKRGERALRRARDSSAWLDRWRSALLAIAAGVAMALALPGIGMWPLLLAVPGLLLHTMRGAKGGQAFRLGWLAGFAQWLIGAAWVVIVLARYGHLGLPLALVGLALMAAILALGWGLVGWAVQGCADRWQAWVLPVALAAFEQVQHLPPWIFPWNPAAAAVTGVPLLLRPLPVIGAAGLSLALFLIGAGLERVLWRTTRRQGAAILAAGAALWGVPALLAPGFVASGMATRVAAIQPNVPLEMRWERDNLGEIEQRVWTLTESAVAEGIPWVVWPESAIPRLIEHDAAYRMRLDEFARSRGVWLLVGSIGFGRDDDYFNSVYSLTPGGLTPWRFDKVHLVPFGEYVPLVGTLPFLRPLVREVGGFKPGASLVPLPAPPGAVGVAVCYEVAYPSLYAQQVLRGARVLATITNDGWYGDSAAPRQHLALAILRAAESRRYLVRAANTGISAVIDPFGAVMARLDFGREGRIEASVMPSDAVTFYVAWGGAIRAGLALVAIGVIILARRRRAQE